VKRQPVDLIAVLLADVDALDGAACAGSNAPFVDVTDAQALEVIRAYCWRCPAVGRCRAVGDALAPHEWPSVFGARHYASGEPVDGWDVVAS
jgi:hypothetical protein